MALRKVFGILTILCLLTLTGAVLAVSAQETQPPIGSDLEYELPMDTMEVIGRYNVTIDPTENFTVEPINLDSPLEVRRDTPIGALDAVARSNNSTLSYTTYYYTISDRLAVDSITNGTTEYAYEEDKIWYVLNYLNETYHETSLDTRTHNLTDGETLWFIYSDLSNYDPRYESRTDRAIAGLSITVTFGEENVTTGNVTPTQTTNATTGNVTPTQTPAELMSLNEVIGEDDNLSVFAGLLNATNLSTTLQGEGPYTVFAPSNDAFGNLSSEVFVAVLTDNTEQMRVLSNHVVNGSYPAAELLNMTQSGNTTTLTTLIGTNLTVSANDSVLMVDNATISMPEINASNGVVHVIDRVLVPPENTTG